MSIDTKASERNQKWDRRYLELGKFISEWSKYPNAKVGAVIVNQTYGRLISTGFNGFPSNVEDKVERLSSQEIKLSMTIHAEQNALLFAGRESRGCDIFVIGKPVCSMCATMIIQSGIKRVKATRPDSNSDSKWDKIGLRAVSMLQEAGIAFEDITEEEISALHIENRKPRESLPYSGAFLDSQTDLFDQGG